MRIKEFLQRISVRERSQSRSRYLFTWMRAYQFYETTNCFEKCVIRLSCHACSLTYVLSDPAREFSLDAKCSLRSKKILAAVLPLSLSLLSFPLCPSIALLRMRFSGLSKPSSIYVRTETSRGQNGLGVVYHNNNACCQGMWMNGTGEHWLLEPVFFFARAHHFPACLLPSSEYVDGWLGVEGMDVEGWSPKRGRAWDRDAKWWADSDLIWRRLLSDGWLHHRLHLGRVRWAWESSVALVTIIIILCSSLKLTLS